MRTLVTESIEKLAYSIEIFHIGFSMSKYYYSESKIVIVFM